MHLTAILHPAPHSQVRDPHILQARPPACLPGIPSGQAASEALCTRLRAPDGAEDAAAAGGGQVTGSNPEQRVDAPSPWAGINVPRSCTEAHPLGLGLMSADVVSFVPWDSLPGNTQAGGCPQQAAVGQHSNSE
jgi:hypothetical protein